MKKRVLVNLVKYGCAALFTALLAWYYLSSREYGAASLMDKYRYICDAFFIPGILMILSGALLWVAGQGSLDGISYLVRYMVYTLIPGKRLNREERYADYVERRQSKRASGYGFLFLAGAVDVVIACVFMALFYSLYNQA